MGDGSAERVGGDTPENQQQSWQWRTQANGPYQFWGRSHSLRLALEAVVRSMGIFSLILAIGLVALVCLQMAGKLPVANAAEGTFQRTLQVIGPVSIDISTDSGGVNVRPGNSGQVLVMGHVKVTSWFGGNDQQRVKKIVDNPPIQQSRGEIRIGHITNSGFLHNVSIGYDLVVPPQTRLRSSTGSGDQTIEGLQGQLEIETGSGNLKISDIGDTVRADSGSGDIEIYRVKGNVHAEVGSGSINATEVAGGFEGSTGSGGIYLDQSARGPVRAETGSGGIELRGVRGPLEATAGSGNITVEGNPMGRWTVNTDSGDVRLKLASEAAFDLDAHTDSGSISISQPITVQGAQGPEELRGKVQGGGVPVEIATASGNIQIR
ncbi:MAG: DUF4097 family beta strand repeat protein [Deltaproteobacteria bacterium]|nr:DUF4097 family beta strand repeat protein [Deltaproteobacteria bacterium]